MKTPARMSRICDELRPGGGRGPTYRILRDCARAVESARDCGLGLTHYGAAGLLQLVQVSPEL
jgi:hypothetical protein